MRLGHQHFAVANLTCCRALLLSYCIFRNDTLFTFVQVINITAIVATIVLARIGNRGKSNPRMTILLLPLVSALNRW